MWVSVHKTWWYCRVHIHSAKCTVRCWIEACIHLWILSSTQLTQTCSNAHAQLQISALQAALVLLLQAPPFWWICNPTILTPSTPNTTEACKREMGQCTRIELSSAQQAKAETLSNNLLPFPVLLNSSTSSGSAWWRWETSVLSLGVKERFEQSAVNQTSSS